MRIQSALTRPAVIKAMREFDRLGRGPFLEKYHFHLARSYFLVDHGRFYDSKAIVGAEYGFSRRGASPLSAEQFSGGEKTIKRWLEALEFIVQKREAREVAKPPLASGRLDVGAPYTRAQLRKMFAITDATLNTGVFRPRGYRSIWLFVTEKKTQDRTQFEDGLVGNILQWQGQASGRTDPLIVGHVGQELEVLVFYRREKYQYAGAAFRYEGKFRYVGPGRNRSEKPTSFVLSASPSETRRRWPRRVRSMQTRSIRKTTPTKEVAISGELSCDRLAEIERRRGVLQYVASSAV